MTKKKPLDDAFSYCRELVARDDPDRYLASLFAPRAARPAIWALLAFNQDIARVRDNVTDPNLGYIRLQWVREQIDHIYAGKDALAGPVYAALRAVIQIHDLPRNLFDVLINAREFDLGARGPETVEELIDYADQTTTPLLALCAQIILPFQGEDNLSNIALAYALIGLVRASEFHLDTRGWHMIPSGGNVADIVKFAGEYLQGREASVPTDPSPCQGEGRVGDLPAMIRAMAAITDIHARRLEKAGFDVQSHTLTIPPPFLALRVWARVRGLVFFRKTL